MFYKFCKEFNVVFIKKKTLLFEHNLQDLFGRARGASEFLQNFSGCTFGDGLYRIHRVEEINKWNSIVCSVFPELSRDIICFAYDWLGRHFALDFRRKEHNEPMILMLEPGTGEALEIPATFIGFHEEELIEYQDAALAAKFFSQWKEKNRHRLLPNECVGYRVPLFLGGNDYIENLEVNDIGVYWEICAQLLNKTRDLPPGTTIKDVTIS